MQAVHDLKISTYIVEPVEDADGNFLGTLCAVSNRRLPVDENALPVLNLCARLIGDQLRRDRRARQVQQDDGSLARRVAIDPLTGLANRHGLEDELVRSMARALRESGRVCVAFIGLDDFESITDRHGQEGSESFLLGLAGRLAGVARAGEVVGRYGHDEFMVIARVPGTIDDAGATQLARRFAGATQGRFAIAKTTLDSAGASIGTAVSRPGDTLRSLVQRADDAMYEARQTKAHRARTAGPSIGIPIP